MNIFEKRSKRLVIAERLLLDLKEDLQWIYMLSDAEDSIANRGVEKIDWYFEEIFK